MTNLARSEKVILSRWVKRGGDRDRINAAQVVVRRAIVDDQTNRSASIVVRLEGTTCDVLAPERVCTKCDLLLFCCC